MKYKPSLCFSPAGIDACALWRMYMPHLNIPHSRFQFTQGVPPINDLAECDIVVVQRLLTDNNIEFMQYAKQFGLQIIYDLDDNLWNLPKANPAYFIFKDPQMRRGLEACAEWADVITVSTFPLKRVVEREWGHLKNVKTKKPIPIVQIPNRIDLKLFKPISSLLSKDSEKLTLGWGGSNTHDADLAVLWKIIPELLTKYPHVHFEFAGSDIPLALTNHPRVKLRPWVHVSEYHNRLATWNWDIFIAPLEAHKFNRSKSAIKMIEAGALSKPCLAQDVQPYEDFCSHAQDLKWLLCDDWTWKKKLEYIIENPSFREDLGHLMYEVVLDHYTIERSVSEWEEASHLAMRHL